MECGCFDPRGRGESLGVWNPGKPAISSDRLRLPTLAASPRPHCLLANGDLRTDPPVISGHVSPPRCQAEDDFYPLSYRDGLAISRGGFKLPLLDSFESVPV